MGSLFEYKKIYVIDSAERTSGDNSDFTYTFQLEPGFHFDKIALIDIIVPRTMYLVRPGLNTFTLQEGPTQVTITVPIGNYNYISFGNVVAPLISSASPNGLTYTIAYPPRNVNAELGKYNFGQNNGAIQSSFIFGDGLAEQFGFDKGSTNTFVGTALESKNVINFGLINTAYLTSNAVRGTNYNSILQEIYMTGPPFSDVYWQNFDIDATSRDLQTNDTNEYQFSLVDEDFNKIDLNGANLIFTIVLYRESVFQKLARTFFLTFQYVIARLTSSVNPPENVLAGQPPGVDQT